MGKEEKFRIADDQVRGELAAAQEWTCGTCGRELVAGAATVVFASPAEGSPADRAPVLVHESCADEQRASFPNWGDARETRGRAGDPAAAESALDAAVALHRDAINTRVEQAVAPLNRKMAQLEQLVAGLEQDKQKLLSHNKQWSEAYHGEKAHREELEQRLKRFFEATVGRRYISEAEWRRAVVEHLRPEQAQA